MNNCPTCDRTLKAGAKRCVCGWSETPTSGSKLLEHSLDARCQWTASNRRCCYPVKFFEAGSRTGYCRYHMPESEKIVTNSVNYEFCEKVVDYSYKDTDIAYQLRTDFETYGEGIPPTAAKNLEKLHVKRDLEMVPRTKTSPLEWKLKS